MMKDSSFKRSGIYKKLLMAARKNKYILIAIAVGAVILMFPSGAADDSGGEEYGQERMWEEFPVEEQEERLQSILSCIDGVGEVRVALSLDESTERIIAKDDEISAEKSSGESSRSETVIVSYGSGTEEAVTLKYLYPVYRGAIVSAVGAADTDIKLDITRAVSSFTGLSTDKITVVKMEKGQEDK